MYITCGDSPIKWLCSALCSMPPFCNASITGVTSDSSSTRSPIAITWPPPISLNAAHDPSASAGLIATPSSVTARSPRGKLTVHVAGLQRSGAAEGLLHIFPVGSRGGRGFRRCGDEQNNGRENQQCLAHPRAPSLL